MAGEDQDIIQMVMNGEALEYPQDDGAMPPEPEREPVAPEPEDKAPEGEGEKPATEEVAPEEAKPEGEPEDPKYAALNAKIAELEAKAEGLLGKGTAEAKKRQAIEAKLSQMTDFMVRMKTNAEAAAQKEEAPKPKFKGFRVEMTEDGDAYVPEEQLEEFFKGKLKPIEQSISSVTAKTEAVDVKTAVNDMASRIVAEHEAYPEAYKTVNSTWTDLVTMIAGQNGGKIPPMATAPMLGAALKPAVRKTFQAKYPNVNLSDLVITFTEADPEIWTENLRTMLKAHVPRGTAPAPVVPDAKKTPAGLPKVMKDLAGKPNTLAGTRSAIGPQPTDLDRIADIEDPMEFQRMMNDPKNRRELDDLLRSMG